MGPGSVVAAVVAATELVVAGVGVAVALAALAGGEVPVAALALVTLATVRVGDTQTLARRGVTEVVTGTAGITVTR